MYTPGKDPIKSFKTNGRLTSPIDQRPAAAAGIKKAANAMSEPTSCEMPTNGSVSASSGSVTDPLPIDVAVTIRPTNAPIAMTRAR
jgi:hypothetical protein